MNYGDVLVTNKQKALEIHKRGFNCAQSVLCTCGEYTGLDEKTALAISGGFGCGMRCGEICGAVSGAMMAIGLCLPYNESGDAQSRNRVAALGRELTADFEARYGCMRCRDLKRAGFSCDELIAYEAEKAMEIIKNNIQYGGNENGNL